MKLIIDGREYDGKVQPFLDDLRILKKAAGFGFGTVIEAMSRVSTDSNIVELMNDEQFIEGLQAWMWLVRRRAGERSLTFEEAGMISLDEIRIVSDDSDAPQIPSGEPPDPMTAPPLTDSGQGDGAEQAAG